MENKCKFFASLGAGIVTLAFLIGGLSAPAQMIFELKPYARTVLQYGNVANWTAEDLNLAQEKFDKVKENYALFRKKNQGGPGSDSSEDGDSDSSDSDEEALEEKADHENDNKSPLDNTRLRRGGFMSRFIGDGETEVNYTLSFNTADSSSSEGESSESVEMTLADRLRGVPKDQTVKLGLFVSKLCSVSQDGAETCNNIPLLTGMENVYEASEFAEKELTMQFWNNVRMESIFSLIACVGGLICILATIKPCCHVEETPLYLGALSFLATAVLAYTPIIRIGLIASDFTESLEAEMNVTTELQMPWALVLTGVGGATALLALVFLVFGRFGKMTKRLYTMLSPRDPGHTNGDAVKLHHVGGHHKDSEKEITLLA